MNDVCHVAAPPAPGKLERHQRQHRVQRVQLAGGRPAGRIHQPGQVECDQVPDQQEQPGVLGLKTPRLGPLALLQHAHLLCGKPPWLWPGLRCRGRSGHPREPLLPQDLPHRGARERRPRPRKLCDDLLDPVPLTAQDEHPLAGGVLLGLALGPRARAGEQLGEVRLPVAGDQRLHAALAVAEALSDLAGRALLDPVRAQRLVTTLRGERRLGEALVS